MMQEDRVELVDFASMSYLELLASKRDLEKQIAAFELSQKWAREQIVKWRNNLSVISLEMESRDAG